MPREQLTLGEIEISPQTISNPDELLYRQVTPSLWVKENGRPVSHAFGPQSADRGKPSYSRGSRVSAREAYDWHNENARSASHGVWACSVAEVYVAGLCAVDDSATNTNAAPGHCYVDFRGLSKSEERNMRSILYRFAIARGVQYPDSADLAPLGR